MDAGIHRDRAGNARERLAGAEGGLSCEDAWFFLRRLCSLDAAAATTSTSCASWVPMLPKPWQSLWPDLKVATVVGWKEGETPDVPEDLAVTAYASDLANPRTVHASERRRSGRVVEGARGKPLYRPKDTIRGWIVALAAFPGDIRLPMVSSVDGDVTLLDCPCGSNQVHHGWELPGRVLVLARSR